MPTSSPVLADVAASVRADAVELTLDLSRGALDYLRDGRRWVARAALTHPSHLPEATASELVELAHTADHLVERLERIEQELANLSPVGEDQP